MKTRRYRIRPNDDAQCDQCGYPMNVGEYAWINDATGRLFCSWSCATRWEKHQDHGFVLVNYDGPRHPNEDRVMDYGGADDQCGHVSSDADPGL